MQMIQEIGHMIAPYALPAIAAILGYFAKKSGKVIESIVGKKDIDKVEQELKQKRGFAYDAVRLAQDAYSQFSGETRLKHAVEWATNQATQYGFKVTPDEFEGLCRAAFADMVKELKTKAETPAAPEKPAKQKTATKEKKSSTTTKKNSQIDNNKSNQ